MLEIISSDDTNILFYNKEVLHSNLLKSFYYEETSENGEKKLDESIKLDYISDEQLQILKSLLQNLVYYDLNQETIKKINNYNDIFSPIKDILNIRKEFTMDKFFKLMDICNFLDIPILLHILKMKIYTLIDSNTNEDIVKMFNINKELVKEKDSYIETHVKETEINEIITEYKLKTEEFTKKENEAIEILESFLLD
tara:strand:+ start:3676 stop:4266 length:591 start_codon:yes stop_codon:yes gene_type:complete